MCVATSERTVPKKVARMKFHGCFVLQYCVFRKHIFWTCALCWPTSHVPPALKRNTSFVSWDVSLVGGTKVAETQGMQSTHSAQSSSPTEMLLIVIYHVWDIWCMLMNVLRWRINRMMSALFFVPSNCFTKNIGHGFHVSRTSKMLCDNRAVSGPSFLFIILWLCELKQLPFLTKGSFSKNAPCMQTRQSMYPNPLGFSVDLVLWMIRLWMLRCCRRLMTHKALALA